MAAFFYGLWTGLYLFAACVSARDAGAGSNSASHATQQPLRQSNKPISQDLFFELEQLARIVDISYCVGTAGLGIAKPFQCASRCGDEDFKDFELIATWNTGVLLSDSCGYIVVSHPPSPPRIILAFRGTYSVANTIADLSTIPQEYIPYPGDDDGETPPPAFLNLRPTEETPPSKPPKCENCTVHTGFYSSWLNTRAAILPDLTAALETYPGYKLVLVGHSLGGAVAALAGLDFKARGWDPHVTTFGEPRTGNKNLMKYINARFDISTANTTDAAKFRRVTHASDPIPLLPLEEWGYAMHSEELFISAPDLPPTASDIRRCTGDEDPLCIAGDGKGDSESPGWGIPTRFKFWQLFFAHRDYFWRLGLCVPGVTQGSEKWYKDAPPTGTGDEQSNHSDQDDALEL